MATKKKRNPGAGSTGASRNRVRKALGHERRPRHHNLDRHPESGAKPDNRRRVFELHARAFMGHVRRGSLDRTGPQPSTCDAQVLGRLSRISDAAQNPMQRFELEVKRESPRRWTRPGL
jgi:hypothetical protein